MEQSSNHQSSEISQLGAAAEHVYQNHKTSIELLAGAAALVGTAVVLKQFGVLELVASSVKTMASKAFPEMAIEPSLEGSTLLAEKTSATAMRDLLERTSYAVHDGKAWLPTLRRVESGAELKVSYRRTEIDGPLDRLYQSTRKAVVQLQVRQANTEATSFGTGFFVSPEGHLATNYHVVKGARDITIKTAEGLSYKGVVIARDKIADTALVKLTDLKGAVSNYLKFEESGAVGQAEDLHVIGHPLHSSNEIMSSGKSSGFVLDYAAKIDRKLVNVSTIAPEKVGWRTGSQVLDIPVLEGSSGSPVVNARGDVVGIVRERNAFKSYATAVEHLSALSKQARLNTVDGAMLDVRTYYWNSGQESAAATLSSKPLWQFERAQKLLGGRIFPNDASIRLERFRTVVSGAAY